MKIIMCVACMMMYSMGLISQIVINHEHLPDEGDSLISFVAELQGDIDISATGENFVWDFSDNVVATGQNAPIECASLSNLSFFNLFFFQNPVVPDYFSDFGIGVDAFEVPDFGITVEDAYQIYKNSGGVYAITGQVATINSIPVSAKFEDRDVIYDLPLSYGVSGNSDSELQFDVPTVLSYQTQQTRSYECDGWGTLQMCGQSFDVLRVRTVQNGVDTITASFFPVPFGIERPETITYEWLSTSYKVPVLSIATADFQTTVNVAPVCLVLGNERSVVTNRTVQIYPLPASDVFWVDGLDESKPYVLLNSAGLIVRRDVLHPGIPADISDLPPGMYHIHIPSAFGRNIMRVVKY